MTAPYYLHLFLSTEDSSLSSVLQSCHSQFRTISTCHVPSESYLVLFYSFPSVWYQKILKDNILFMAGLILLKYSLNASHNIFLKC